MVPPAISAGEISYIINHSDAKAVFADNEFGKVVAQVVPELTSVETFVNICDIDDSTPLDGPEYESLLDDSPSDPVTLAISDEREVLAINYTSGTTGRPKGVMYHHRGAYLNALAQVGETGLVLDSV